MRDILWKMLMIKKLKRKFILLATISTFLLMTTLIGIMNVVNFSSIITETDTILDVLIKADGRFENSKNNDNKPPKEPKNFVPHGMSPEVPYESRFFTAKISNGGEIIDQNTSKIISVTESDVEEYVAKAIISNKSRGFIEQFRFKITSEGDNTKLTFLDCGRKLDSYFFSMWVSIGVGLLGCVIVFAFFLFASGRIIRPIAESYEKQKQFITDAGHEIKTPLTIINANLDLLSDEIGENECVSDIQNQTTRLSELTSDLVYLSKMEESGEKLPKVDFPLSDLVFDTANSFKTLVMSQNKEFNLNIQPSLSMNGSPDSIKHLVSILVENAIKYSPENGTISVELSKLKKSLILSVYNTTIEQIDKDKLPLVFERFYRTDASRNSETGGHGIGLSIAKAITESHNGVITASTESGLDFKITAIFPQ